MFYFLLFYFFVILFSLTFFSILCIPLPRYIYIIVQKVTYVGCLVTELSKCCILYQAGKFPSLLSLLNIYFMFLVLLQAIHTTPVMSMEFDPTSTLLATGGSDRLIKLWDSVQQYCTHNLSGHTGVVRWVEHVLPAYGM